MSMSANLYCLTQMVVGPLGLVHKQVQTHFPNIEMIVNI